MLREAFKDLLKRWGRANDLQFIAEHDIVTAKGNRIYTDGALLHALRVPFGYWEAKDEGDDLAKEIEDKFRRGYPRDNILFTDDVTAVLYQNGVRAGDAAMDDVDALLALLTRFFAHERAAVAEFRKAMRQFATDLPAILAELRRIIAEKRAADFAFGHAETAFLTHAREAINPTVSEDDVQEMLIQHILTEDIFAKVFDNPDFHRQNNIAAELYKLEAKLFGYGERQRLLRGLAPYYSGIAATAAQIESHSEKQGFLKALYEQFYKVYNPLAADRLGVVYTPGEIVRFMIRSADWLCEKHFGKSLSDRGVEILDPATGTGTFIVELLEHFRGDHAKLRHKYKEELHANEVAILPYYVANLNIEATYAAITGQFAEFENLCFVDTLDNVEALETSAGHQPDMLGSLAMENYGRIKRQNERKISVVIGNPPYNANQENENHDNKNQVYNHIDKRISQTYLKLSKARKTKLYDPFVRFYRWSTDRLADDGIVAFITNRSFIDKKTFDGFRRQLRIDFQAAYVVDLGGDYLLSDDGGGGNVFGIGTGVAVCFLVRNRGKTAQGMFYVSSRQGSSEDKLSWLQSTDIAQVSWTTLPDRADGAWRDIPEDHGASLLPIGVREADVRSADEDQEVQAIFRLSSLGVVTARDEWVWAFKDRQLRNRLTWFRDEYERLRQKLARVPRKQRVTLLKEPTIKLSRALKSALLGLVELPLERSYVRRAAYRPFSMRKLYYHSRWNEVQYNLNAMHAKGRKNSTLIFTDAGSQKPFMASATDRTFDYHYVGGAAAAVGLPRYRYTKSGERVDNITDWALAQFEAHYSTNPPLKGEGDHAKHGGGVSPFDREHATSSGDTPPSAAGAAATSPSGGGFTITKDLIFHYVYAVLHDPVYRETYALNLKREFPRIPFYPDFARWAAWGETLLGLHIGYEDVEPFALTRVDTPAPRRAEGTHPKPKLKSHPEQGLVIVDEDTQLTGIPPAAWTYRLGNRSAIDWVLDQHKEKTPRDPTIREKFNNYRFADHKEAMIALLARVVRVSLDTVAITDAMRALDRAG